MGLADLHIHSDYSDGAASVERILFRACHLGLDTIAVTDHNEIAGALEARRLAERWQLPVQVIVGEEVTTSEGHVVGLFLKERIRPLLTAQATVDEIHRQGGLAIAVHPFSAWLKMFDCGGVGRLVERLQFDALETANGNITEGFSNAWTRGYNRRVTRLAELGGSDAHTEAAIGQGVTVYPGAGAGMLRQAIYYRATTARESAWKLGAMADFLKNHLLGKMDLYGAKGGAIGQSGTI
ncbi:MAG TPA: CehA/McbA family metallohydrolase [Candidatus Edwardsbacteria bacterium]|nr:CehA/McbA family metallohydrolase [Candidatus Edwardsbacteria bacterium]